MKFGGLTLSCKHPRSSFIRPPMCPCLYLDKSLLSIHIITVQVLLAADPASMPSITFAFLDFQELASAFPCLALCLLIFLVLRMPVIFLLWAQIHFFSSFFFSFLLPLIPPTFASQKKANHTSPVFPFSNVFILVIDNV